ncbi:hypothetical protein SBRY_20433 [Actinacidiphila bryophytorum]|uniref:Uncharacterized protein n=1 Tax=Actinacidiphila bryophytorum TaxID=1436133 RepID=A0A9W4GY66_9ACTN|nr:hypothetical protein SBRY_20433 [Actinacidiphila bryophytorum]
MPGRQRAAAGLAQTPHVSEVRSELEGLHVLVVIVVVHALRHHPVIGNLHVTFGWGGIDGIHQNVVGDRHSGKVDPEHAGAAPEGGVTDTVAGKSGKGEVRTTGAAVGACFVRGLRQEVVDTAVRRQPLVPTRRVLGHLIHRRPLAAVTDLVDGSPKAEPHTRHPPTAVRPSHEPSNME